MHLISAFLVFAVSSISCAQQGSDLPSKNSNPMTYLALGDSYTIGTSLSNENERFPTQLTAKLNAADIPTADPYIIARNGWTTGDLIEATNDFHPDSAYSLVSLLIGVNNQYQGQSIEDYAVDFRLLLERAIQYAGNDTSRVFVFSIPDYGVTPFGKKKDDTGRISREINNYNAVNKNITDELGVSYFDITPISRKAENDPDLVAPDGLHPSGKMYDLWIDAYFDEIRL